MTGPDVQLDLFGEVEHAETEQDRIQRVQDDREQLRWLDCCTGQPCPPGPMTRVVRADGGIHLEVDPTREPYRQVRCGRCGAYTFEYGMTINHDLGFGGCYDTDEPLQRLNGDAAVAWIDPRHDRLHHPDCVCGCPWGWHRRVGQLDPRGYCPTRRCPCDSYRPGPAAAPQPSRCGPAWDPEP